MKCWSLFNEYFISEIHPNMEGLRAEEFMEGVKRRFAKSLLDVLILKLVSRKPTWGYKLISILKEAYGVKVGPSVLYPLLNRLEGEGFVSSRTEFRGRRRRRVYEITEKGLELLAAYGDFLRAELNTVP